MKNKKILVGLLSASGIAMMLPAITSCAGNNTNEPKVSSQTPKEREVGAKATRTYFYIIQSNVKNPEETKVKMINLKVNGAEAQPVSGLIKYVNDSAGNILVVFNMSLAQTQYQADSIKFDLKLTNKTAGTEYTLTGFSVSVTDKASAVTYNTDECPGLIWAQNPDTVVEGEHLDIQFKLEKGYKWQSPDTVLDVTINGTSIRGDLQALEAESATLGRHYWYFDVNEAMCYIYVPAEEIDSNSDIQVTLKSQGETYDVDQTSVGANFTCDPQFTSIQHGTGKKVVEFHPNNYYQTQSWDVKMGSVEATATSLKESGAAVLVENNTKLEIDTSKVVDKLWVSATAVEKEWNVTLDKSTAPNLSFKEIKKSKYGEDYQGILVADPIGYKAKDTTATCVDDASGQESDPFPITFTQVPDSDSEWKFTIPAQYVKGDIKIVGAQEGKTYYVNTKKVTGFKTTTIPTQIIYPTGINATLTPDGYHTFKPATGASTWDVECTNLAGTESLRGKGASFSDDTTLIVEGDKILGNLTITATADNGKWDVEIPTLTTHMNKDKSTWTWAQSEYTKDFTGKIKVTDPEYTYKLTAASYFDADNEGQEHVFTSAELGEVTTSLDKDNNELSVTIPSKFVLGKISLTFTETANTYTVSKTAHTHIDYTDCPATATHDDPNGYKASITVDDPTQWKIDPTKLSVKTTTGSVDVPHTFTQDETDKSKYNLYIEGSKLTADFTIDAGDAVTATFAYTSEKDAGIKSLTPSEATAVPYGTNYPITYALGDGKTIDKTNTKCVVTNIKTKTTTTLTHGNGLNISDPSSGTGTITITGTSIIGDLKLTVKSSDISYTPTVSATGMAIKGATPTAKFHEAMDINLTMTSDTEHGFAYVLKTDDFQNGKVKVTMGGTKDLVYGTDYDITTTPGSEAINIKENVIEGDITVTGGVTNAKTTVTLTGFTELTKDVEYKLGSQFSFNVTFADNYSTPSAEIYLEGKAVKQWTENSEYTLTHTSTSTTLTVTVTSTGATALTAPLQINLKALSTTTSFTGTPQENVAVGDTTSEYTARAIIAGTMTGTPNYSLNAGSTGATWGDQTHKITASATTGDVTLTAQYYGSKATQTIHIVDPGLTLADATLPMGGSGTLTPSWKTLTPSQTVTYTYASSDSSIVSVTNAGVITPGASAAVGSEATITVKATYGTLTEATALSTTCKVTISEAEEITVTGSHDLDIDSSEGETLTANTANVTWSVTSGDDLVSLSASSGKTTTVSLKTAAKTAGGEVTITCSPASSDSNIDPVTFDMVIYSKSQLTITIGSESAGITKGTITSSKIVLPGKCYNESLSKWVPTYVVNYGFQGDTTIQSVIFGEGLERIGGQAFINCYNITSISIPVSLTSIGLEAFECTYDNPGKISSITFPVNSKLEAINTAAFMYQTSLTTITIPETNGEYELIGYVFSQCTSISEVHISSKCKTLGANVFFGHGTTTALSVYIDSETIGLQTSGLDTMLQYASTIYVKTAITQEEGWSSSIIATTFTVKGTETGGYIPCTKS